MLATRQNLKVSMFKNLKTLDPRFREGDEGDVAGMTESVWLRQISRREIIPAFYCCHSRESGNPESTFAEDSKAEKLKSSRDK